MELPGGILYVCDDYVLQIEKFCATIFHEHRASFSLL